MINNLAKRFADRLLKSGSISEDEQELYIYGLFMLLSSLMYFALACFLGLILGCILESVIFFVAFQFIRRYAGGYHASTETRCEILSALSIALCIAVIRLSTVYRFSTALFVAALLSAICIFILCPLDTPEKPLSEREHRYFRKISRVILAVLTVTVTASYLISFKWLNIFFAPCCLSLILECILLAAGKLKQQILGK